MTYDDFKKLPEIKEQLLKIERYFNKVDELGEKMVLHLAGNTLHELIKDFETTQMVYADYINYVTEYPETHHGDGYPVTLNEFYENDWGN